MKNSYSINTARGICLKTTKTIILMLLVVLIPVLSCAEPGKVNTEKGNLNMRKKPEDGARLVTTIPNGSAVEVLDHVDGWYQIEYKGKTGYVKEQFIVVLSNAVGKEIYSNGTTVYVRESMDFNAPIIAVVNSQQPMTVEQITAEWALVATDEVRGYVRTGDVDELNGEPVAPATNLWEEGVLQSKTVLYKEANKNSGKIGTYQRGQLVYVSTYDKNWSLIWIPDQGVIGFAKKPSVKLTGTTSTDEPEGTIVVDESISIPVSDAKSIAEKALNKYSGFNAGKLNCTWDAVLSSRGIKGPMYRFSYTNQNGDYLYAAYVHQYTGDVLYTGDYSAFVKNRESTTDLRTAAPTQEPVWEYDEDGNITNLPEPQTGTDIGKSEARSIADRYLSSRYPWFAGTSFSRVSSQHFTDPLQYSFQTPCYQLDYFVRDESGNEQLVFEIVINAYTKEIEYFYGDAPGEGNG